MIRKTIKKIFIANRGEIACRITSSARAMGISVVVIYTYKERKSRFVEEADEHFCLPDGELHET